MITLRNKNTRNELVYLNSFIIDGKVLLLLAEKNSGKIILLPKDNYEYIGEE